MGVGKILEPRKFKSEKEEWHTGGSDLPTTESLSLGFTTTMLTVRIQGVRNALMYMGQIGGDKSIGKHLIMRHNEESSMSFLPLFHQVEICEQGVYLMQCVNPPIFPRWRKLFYYK